MDINDLNETVMGQWDVQFRDADWHKVLEGGRVFRT